MSGVVCGGRQHGSQQAKHQPGTGLVLFIVKSSVEAHDGRVEVESTLGAGTRFSMFLPVTADEPIR